VNKQQAIALHKLVGEEVIDGATMVTFKKILDGLKNRGLYFPDELVANYLLALQTKRFVILTGISGTGKTKLAMSVAEEFPAWGERTVTRPHGEDAVTISVKPYMKKHRRFVVPARLVEFTDWELSEGAKSMGRLTVAFGGNTIEQSFYRSPKRNVTILLLSGELREWFIEEFEVGDEFSLELLSGRPDGRGSQDLETGVAAGTRTS
jgi:hypothetical protein